MMASSTLLHSATLISGGRSMTDAWVLLADGVVRERGTGDGWRPRTVPGTTVIDAAGAYLTPGFIDIHGHGGAGVSYDSDADAAAVQSALACHRTHGTTRHVLSLVTAPVPAMCARLALIADLVASDPAVLGSHLEGPFLALSHKGAHDPALLRRPTPELVAEILGAARGTLRQVTLAPELPGALDAVARFAAAGVVPAVGHTAADAAVTREAFAAGARLLTHAFNGMPGIHHRAPGPVVAALEDPRVVLEIINDGVHVDPAVVALLFAAAPGRVALVTDAMAAAGSADGEYLLGSLAVTVFGGVARLRDADSIAGSTLTLDRALRRAVVECGVGLPAAVAALTEVPARAVGRPDLGRLDPGSPADVVLLSPDLVVRGVWSRGVLVPGTNGGDTDDRSESSGRGLRGGER